MRRPKAPLSYLATALLIAAGFLIFFNIKSGLALYDAPEWLSPMEGDYFVSNGDGTVTVNFSVYANEPGAGNQVRMYLQVIDDASSTPVALDNGGFGSWVDSIDSNIPHEFGTSTLPVKLDPIRKYRYTAWVVNDSGVTTTAPTLENAIVPGSGFPPQSTKPTVDDDNIYIASSANMVHAYNNVSFKFLDAWTGVNGYIIDRKILGEPTWVEGATFYTYDDNRVTLGHPNQIMFPDGECQSGRVCFSLDDPSAVEPNVVYQYRIRLAYRASPSDPVIAPQDGGKASSTSASLVDIPTFDAFNMVATSTHASSSMRLYFHAPAPLDSYSNDGNPGFDYYEGEKIVDGVSLGVQSFGIDEYDTFSSPFFSCPSLYQCYSIDDLVVPGVTYQYLVRPCVVDDGQSRCADAWATSSALMAANYLAVPKATAIGTEAPTSTPADSTIRVHFRSDVALTSLPVTHYQLQVVENGTPRTEIPVIASTTGNAAGDTFFGAGNCTGNYRCFIPTTFSANASSINYRITPGNNYVFRVRLAYLGSSPYNNAYSEWIESAQVTAAALLPITLNAPLAVRPQVLGSNLIALALDYVYDPTFLALVKTIPGYSTLTGYEINRFSSIDQIQYRTTSTPIWSPFMSGASYVQAASGTYISNANQTIGDQPAEISPTSTPLTYFYVDPNHSYFFQAKSVNKYVVGQDSAYTQSNQINMNPLPDANNVQVNRYDVTNYDVSFLFDFANSGPTAFYVQWNTVQDASDPGWSTVRQDDVQCTTPLACHLYVYGLDPGFDWYFRVIPIGKLNNQWDGYIKAGSGSIPNIASPIVFSTSSNHSISQVKINFNQPNNWNGFNRYEIVEQRGTWNGSGWNWANSGWAYNGTSTQNTSLNNSEVESTSPPFNGATCNIANRCYQVGHANTSTNPIIPSSTYRYLVRLCTSNGNFCSSDPAWVTSTPIMAPALVPTPDPTTPILTATSTYTKSKVNVAFKYTGGWDGLYGYRIERQVNGGAWTLENTYTSTSGATTSPPGCATPNTCYVQSYSNLTPSSTYAYRVRVYAATPAINSNWATSSPIEALKYRVAGMPTEPIIVPRACFGSGCFDLHVRFAPDLIAWINRYKSEASYSINYPVLYFDVRYKKPADSTWEWGGWFATSWDHRYEDSSLYASGKCTKSRECYSIPTENLAPNETYDVALSVYGEGYTPYSMLVDEIYPMGQVTTLPSLSGEINPPDAVDVLSDDIGSNLVKLKMDYTYQASLPPLYRMINSYDTLPNGYQVTDRRWDHWLYTDDDGWTNPIPRVHWNQIQMSHDQSNWQPTGILIADDKYITPSNLSLGDNNGELEYPNSLDYYFIDRSGGADTYLRANVVNQYLTVAPPPKYQTIDWVDNWVDWNNSGTSPLTIASTTYVESNKITGLKDFPSMVTLKVDYGDSDGNFNEWEAYLTIEYNYTKSGPTLYEIQQSDSPAPTSGWVDSSPAEAVCTSGNCSIHLTGLTSVDGKYQRFIRVRPKGTTIWMYKNDTVIWRAACLNISFANPTSTPGQALSASMVNEIRQRINVCRANMGSSVGYFSFHNSNASGDTDTQIVGQGLNPMTPNTRIRATHVLELREAIMEMYKSFASDPTNLKYRVTDWPAFWNKDEKGQPLPAECQNLTVGSKICIKHFSVIRQLLVDLEK
ncbi:hypothetical protein HGA34_03080 [Candidatus Falkowbacteria bacterium]|nr:hypothetical protein [Candidatus Falkowbacteria bacterium]